MELRRREGISGIDEKASRQKDPHVEAERRVGGPVSSDPNCLFCKIVRGEIPARKVHEDDEFWRSTTSGRSRRCIS